MADERKPWPSDDTEGARLILEACHALLTGPAAACFITQGVTGQIRLDANAVLEVGEAMAQGCMTRSAKIADGNPERGKAENLHTGIRDLYMQGATHGRS